MDIRKVLVVEDEPGILKPLRSLLERKKCKVFTAATAEEAWDTFMRERPQACSLDLHLHTSSRDGLELLRKIRAADKDVLCVVMTRIIDEKILDEVRTIGDHRIFFKPPSAEEFREFIDLLVGEVARG